MDPSSKWATLACRLAIREARFPEKPAALAELGLFLNLSAGPSWAESEFLTSFVSNDHQVAQLSAFPYIVPSSVAGNVCRALMLTGHNLTLNPGPAAGLHGLEPALAALRCGHAAALLCGAVDELSDRILADHFYAGEISADQPPGEGAAILMLETAAHARARAVQPIAEIHGLASLTRAHPTMDDVNEVISAALTEAALPREALHALLYYGNPAQLPPACREISRPAALAMGRLEGAQPLVDLAGLLCATDLPANGWILSLAVTQHLTCAAVFKKC
jgi:3-oxoacyl-(acyl-carrier-protein) synthase